MNKEKNKSIFPKHLAIIPDGNRRWARSKGMSSSKGHKFASDIKKIKSFFEVFKDYNISYFSIWGFSTENWKRSEKEKENLFNIFFNLMNELEDFLHNKEIRFRHFGRKDRLPKKIIDKIYELEESTKKYNLFNLNFCLDYGGRDEILRAVNKIIVSKKDKINEKDFSSFLDTFDVPDVDMIIRTSGEKRISGFMPFQGTYSELFFVDKHFPDFSKDDLKKLIFDFGKRKRTFGGE